MADSEYSFADRVGKAKLVKEAVESFNPVFSSPNPEDAPLVFGAHITLCETANSDIETLRRNYTNGAVERTEIVKDVVNRAMRSMTNVKSVDAYKAFAKGLAITYRKLRNYKVPGAKKLSPDAKKRNKGVQSFADVENLFKTFLAGLTTIPGYTHPDDGLKLPALNLLYTKFHNKNIAMAELDSAERLMTPARKDLFDNKVTGLSARMLSVKNSVKNQYGLESPEYISIKSIQV